MALREKFGRLVLLEETDSGPLGNEYRAARLGPAGFDRLVTVLRFSPAVSGHAEASRRLVEEARQASQIHTPGIVRALGVGRVGASFYLSTELVEGRTLRAVLASCRDEGFPFGADHALMIASRAAAGLELLHGRKDDAGRPLLHGLLAPRRLVVAFDGEVKLKGLGLWPALAESDLLAAEERAYLAPEQAQGRGDPRSDVYALGLVLLEALSGEPTDESDPLERVARARCAGPGGEPAPLPRALAELLRRALASDPASRFAGMAELRKALDTQLFSGDFTPTTFDLAFFMHTLFRADVEREARAIEEARVADYREFLVDDSARGIPKAPGEPHEPRPPASPPDTVASSTEVPAPTVPEPRSPAGPADASHSRLSARSARDAAARESANRISQGGAAVPRAGISRSLGLALGLLGAVVLGGGAGWLYFLAGRRAAITAAASAEQTAADARVRALEARIAELENEKAAAEARAAEEARLGVEQQAAAGGKPVDPAAVARAEQAARQRAREEQEARQQQELDLLARARRAEQERLAAAATPAPTPAPTPTPAATPTPTPTPFATSTSPATPAPAPTSAPAATSTTSTLPSSGSTTDAETLIAPPAAGGAPSGPSAEPSQPTPPPSPAAAAAPSRAVEAADPSDPAVRLPGLISQDDIPYPRRAVGRVSELVVVVVRALVDENGRVTEPSVSQASGQDAAYGFEEAALKRVRSRKYRPARRNGIPVPIWVLVRVEFRPPPARR